MKDFVLTLRDYRALFDQIDHLLVIYVLRGRARFGVYVKKFGLDSDESIHSKNGLVFLTTTPGDVREG